MVAQTILLSLYSISCRMSIVLLQLCRGYGFINHEDLLLYSQTHGLLHTLRGSPVKWCLANVVASKLVRSIQSSDLGRILWGHSERPGSSMVGFHIAVRLFGVANQLLGGTVPSYWHPMEEKKDLFVLCHYCPICNRWINCKQWKQKFFEFSFF